MRSRNWILLIAGVTWLLPQDAGTTVVQRTTWEPVTSDAPKSPHTGVIPQNICTAAVSPKAWVKFPSDLRAASRPMSAEAWAALSTDEQGYINAADSFTWNYIQVVFGDGPYPYCLYQSVRAYFMPQSASDTQAPLSPLDIKRTQTRRERALSLMGVVAARSK